MEGQSGLQLECGGRGNAGGGGRALRGLGLLVAGAGEKTWRLGTSEGAGGETSGRETGGGRLRRQDGERRNVDAAGRLWSRAGCLAAGPRARGRRRVSCSWVSVGRSRRAGKAGEAEGGRGGVGQVGGLDPPFSGGQAEEKAPGKRVGGFYAEGRGGAGKEDPWRAAAPLLAAPLQKERGAPFWTRRRLQPVGRGGGSNLDTGGGGG